MMLKQHKIKIKIANANKKKYEELLQMILVTNQEIEIEQEQVLPTSRTKVLCECDLCKKSFYRIRKDVAETTLCGTKCRNEYLRQNNPNPEKEEVKVSCEVCTTPFTVSESKFKKQKYFLCSRQCYKIHRSQKYTGSNLYNYQDIKGVCTQCEKPIKLKSSDQKFRRNRFCSPECYWTHRSKNYTELYYQETLFQDRKETIPEQKVREYLTVREISFLQEYKIDRYFVDFYLPEFDVGIEVYGDYWHYNPKVFDGKNKKIHKNQENVHEYDKKRNEFLETKIKKIYIVWENDIKNNFQDTMEELMRKINLNP